jgi:hypothetical protein
MPRRHLIVLCVSSVLASSAFAQATRTWVSGVGDDANPCSRTAPCKTFAGAISKTATGGEINVLDPGGFGAVTITKSMTILAVGMPAGVLVAGTNGIVISNGTGSTMNVTIRGLDFDGVGSGLSGILVTGGAGATTNVRIEDNIIYGFVTAGINVATSGPANVTVVGNRISECSNSPGILADSTNGQVSLNVIETEVHNCSIGLNVIGGTKFNAKNSDFSQNVTGVDLAGATTIGTLDTDTIAYCTTGLNLETSGATVRLTNDTITDNTTGMATVGGGNIVSFGNNRTKGNTTNGAPTATLVQN